MKRFGQQPIWIAMLALMLTCGCSWSRGNLAKNTPNVGSSLDDEVGETKTADAGSADDNAGGPPSQPGAKPKGGSRKKLTGWLKTKEPKRESIPLDRTDTESEKDSEESLADEGNNWWKQSEAPVTADISQAAKKSKSESGDEFQFDQ